jgi:ATP-dependent Lon protease
MGSEIGGSDPGWAQTRTGKVFTQLVEGKYANPIFLLDEIDKTAGSERFSPWSALHDLLEPTAAKKFRDRSFDAVSIDASRITWIATSNDCSNLPSAIASRFSVTYMPLPNQSQLKSVVESVWSRLKIANPICNKFDMAPNLYLLLDGASPRSMGQKLLRACAKAAREKTFTLYERHLPDPPAQKVKRPMGFFP